MAVQLANEMDAVEKLLKEECWDEKHMASIEESQLFLRQNSLQLANTGRNFLLDAEEVRSMGELLHVLHEGGSHETIA